MMRVEPLSKVIPMMPIADRESRPQGSSVAKRHETHSINWTLPIFGPWA
jgi:hypothetical protein